MEPNAGSGTGASREGLLRVVRASAGLSELRSLSDVVAYATTSVARILGTRDVTVALVADGSLERWLSSGPELARDVEIQEPLIVDGELLGLIAARGSDLDATDREALRCFAPFVAAAVASNLELSELRERAENAERNLRSQRDFLSIVSHELRTPLAVVLGYSETLAQNVERLEQEQIAGISSRTRDASRRLGRLIGDLFDLAQADRGTLGVSLYPTSVERVLKQATYEAPPTKHNLEVVCEPDLPPVLADRDRLNQVVVNLVSNATKYSPEGTNVRLLAERRDGEVAITVEDEGMGISAEVKPRIFERFYQAEEGRRKAVSGLGVGLFLVKEICDRMNARIEVNSEVGRGSRFTVCLPVADALAS